MRWPAQAMRILTVVIASLFAGCGGESPAVSGDVTIDSEPLAEGLITFVPADPQAPPVAVKIEGGKYSARIPAGSYLVRINAAKATGEKRKMYPSPDSPVVDIVAERIPEKYNTKTDLRAEIKAGENKLDWPLKSK